MFQLYLELILNAQHLHLILFFNSSHINKKYWLYSSKQLTELLYFWAEKVQSWNESHKSSRETDSKIPMTKFKQCFGIKCFSFRSVVSTGAACMPPRSSGRDAGRSEELCNVSAEHLSTSSSLARPGSRRFSHWEIYYFHFLNPPYRQMQHKLMQYEIESAVE